ncbi:hypothetical protein AHAS_Ahas20G0228200 [Arachis hypogaea]
MRKQNKTNLSRASLGNEEELVASTTTTTNASHTEPEPVHQHPHYHQTNSPTVRFSPCLISLFHFNSVFTNN